MWRTQLVLLCLGLAVTSTVTDPAQRSYDTLENLLQKLQAAREEPSGEIDQKSDDDVPPQAREVHVDDIMSAMERRSQLTSRSMNAVMREVMDTYRRMATRGKGVRGDPKDCLPNPCAHGGTCSTSDLVPGTKYMCYNCEDGYSGLDCGIDDVCHNTRPSPNAQSTCGRGQLCMPTSSNAAGYFCF